MADSAPLVYVVAGEPSGDRLGARLIAALRAATDGRIRFRGVGGDMMANEGVPSLFPLSDLAVMGLAEVLPRLPRLIRRIRETAEDIRATRPAALVTIDSPDFTLRVARRLKGSGFPLIHYVAPSVWAWKPRRARTIAGFLDRIMTLLPFEPPYFTREGLAADFVGHPVLESGADRGDGASFRARFGIPADVTVLALLPGSRASEIARHLPILRETAVRLARTHAGLRLVVPTVAHLERDVKMALSGWPLPSVLVTGEGDKFDAFAAADAAVAASGTVALELAMAGTPTVIVYRMNPITAAIGRRLVKVKYANLVNILLDEEAVPELLLDRCRPDLIAVTVSNLMSDPAAANRQRMRAKAALAMLSPEGASPSGAAAQVVLEMLAATRQ